MNVNSIGVKAIRKISGGTDVALSAGDIAAGETYLLMYRAAANAAAGAWVIIGGAAVAAGSFGQCRLTLSGGNLTLSPYSGNKLSINGTAQTVPSATVTLSASGLSVGTLYYIYAYMSSGTMTLEASTTAYATDTSTGVAIKSGDATRTLVGMARPVTGPAWVDSLTQRYVRTWYNRTPVRLLGARAGSVLTTTSTSYTELSTGLRVEFLSWAGEVVEMASTGWSYNGTTEETSTVVALDGTATDDTTRTRSSTTFNSGGGPAVTSGSVVPSTEGYHYITLMGAVSGNTGVWQPTSGSRDGVACLGMLN
jgi:hypothetical protein